MNKGRNVAVQVQQSMEFDGGLGGTKQYPREDGQTQIDSGSVQCIDRLFSVYEH